MRQSNTGTWIVVIIILALVGVGAWWLGTASQRQVDLGSVASSTDTTVNTGSPTAGSIPVTHSSSDVLTVAAQIGGTATFSSWISSTGVSAQVRGSGPYTIFVPTDGSISQLPAGTFTGLSAAQQKRFVEYSIVSGKAIDADAETAGTISTLSGDSINFSYGANNIPMVNSSIIVAEYKASNGVVYLINRPLIPPQQ